MPHLYESSVPMATHTSGTRRNGAVFLVLSLAAAFLFLTGTNASAAIVPTVPLATSGDYAVLGGSTVTNTGPSLLGGSLGVWPGPEITGFPPGIVLPPATTHTTDAVAQQAQSDLTTAYGNAAGRPLDATTTADLGGLLLPGGVYAGPSKGALGLTGTLTLDGAGNADSVFIFQTDSSLITEVGSRVVLTNGAQECNVFWQVGSSATLGSGSVFVGNILALTSISVDSGVLVHGRALARNGAVTLINDTFTAPTCASGPVPTTTTAAPSTTVAPTSSTVAPTSSTVAPTSTSTPPPTTSIPPEPGSTTTTTTGPGRVPTTTALPGAGTPTTPGGPTPPGTETSLPRTGSSSLSLVLLGLGAIGFGWTALNSGRVLRRR